MLRGFSVSSLFPHLFVAVFVFVVHFIYSTSFTVQICLGCNLLSGVRERLDQGVKSN